MTPKEAHMKSTGWLLAVVAICLIAVAVVLTEQGSTFPQSGTVSRDAGHSVFYPAVSDWHLISSDTTPPTEADCFAAGVRCFTPQSMTAGYNFGPLYASGWTGKGKTIAIIDSFGSPSIANDLHVFDTAFGLQSMCGETGVTCTPDMPTFSILQVLGSPAPLPQPPNNGTGQEDHFAWAVEVSLDVEWAHATAPGANIILVTTPTAETLGVQGFPPMMNAVQYVVDHHLADVVSMSLSAGEGTFKNGTAALQNLRKALMAAQANDVTVLAATGDNGSANVLKEPVKVQPLIPYPSVGWPASDPLVTAVGGTYHCTDPTNTTTPTVDSTDPPVNCQANPGQAEVGWIAGGGGYSILFARPDYQSNLPAGSSYVGSSVGAPGPNTNMRGVPDVAYQASARTAPLVYLGAFGWFTVGGTSCSTPQWAGLVAIGDQISGTDLGFINPALYKIGSDPTRYAADFFDVTHGNNALFAPTIPGYFASQGWDAVTGLGTPNAAALAPDLVAAVHGQ
jgi:subtilase family serine protease